MHWLWSLQDLHTHNTHHQTHWVQSCSASPHLIYAQVTLYSSSPRKIVYLFQVILVKQKKQVTLISSSLVTATEPRNSVELHQGEFFTRGWVGTGACSPGQRAKPMLLGLKHLDNAFRHRVWAFCSLCVEPGYSVILWPAFPLEDFTEQYHNRNYCKMLAVPTRVTLKQ